MIDWWWLIVAFVGGILATIITFYVLIFGVGAVSVEWDVVEDDDQEK